MKKLTVQIGTQIAARYARRVKPALLRKAAQATFDHTCRGRQPALVRGSPGCQSQRVRGRASLTIVVTGDAQLRALNRKFLHIDAPTDVLSFAADEPEPSQGFRYLGDVVISFTSARAQARLGGHPVEAEIQLLVVHGVLHLLGHDHATRVQKAKMWKAQSEILQSIGVAITKPTR